MDGAGSARKVVHAAHGYGCTDVDAWAWPGRNALVEMLRISQDFCVWPGHVGGFKHSKLIRCPRQHRQWWYYLADCVHLISILRVPAPGIAIPCHLTQPPRPPLTRSHNPSQPPRRSVLTLPAWGGFPGSGLGSWVFGKYDCNSNSSIPTRL